ncbi:MAG TPA: TIGR03790 family protein, partial [Bryobacteraceae bacterium]|nr:TIGR03790 family protein [Bryobacteraceae bacterium]
RVVIDMQSGEDRQGDDWLLNAAIVLPKERVVLDQSARPVYGERDVIAYASWGSNDAHHQRRFPGFRWLPGAIATQYVSTDGRTFARPPDTWQTTTWKDRAHWFAGSPQSLAADYLHEGASAVSGHVYEPYLQFTPRPDYLIPAYLSGRNLAESYYLAIPALSWQNIVVGDPLCRLR